MGDKTTFLDMGYINKVIFSVGLATNVNQIKFVLIAFV